MNSFNKFLFEGVAQSDCERLLLSMKINEKTFSKGEMVYRFSSANTDIGILKSGRAKIVKCDKFGNESSLEFLGEGGLFGSVLAFSHSDGEYITVIAQTDLKVDFIPRAEIMKSCDQGCDGRHRVILNVLNLINKKTADLSERVEILSNKTIRDRLLCYFVNLATKANSNEVVLPLSLTLLAEYLAVDRSAMMRELKRLKEDKTLQNVGKKYVLTHKN